jgi:Leucine-rich repeat (LRR) protein
MSLEALRSGQLHGATRVALQAGLTSLPSELFALADTLEILDLSHNQLSELPADLARLRRLKILFCSGNRFTRLPEILGELPALSLIGFRGNQIAEIPPTALPATLQWLILTDNRLRELPPALGGCTRLQKCALAGNQLASLPPEIAACGNLELLRLSANAFVDLPQWLVELPRWT